MSEMSREIEKKRPREGIETRKKKPLAQGHIKDWI
jgi:hypothetical protein